MSGPSKNCNAPSRLFAVTPPADDKPVQVFVVPAHGELHHLMQLRNRDLLGNQEPPPDRRADPAQTDPQLENRSRFGRVGVHRITIDTSLSHIRRPDVQPPLWSGLLGATCKSPRT